MDNDTACRYLILLFLLAASTLLVEPAEAQRGGRRVTPRTDSTSVEKPTVRSREPRGGRSAAAPSRADAGQGDIDRSRPAREPESSSRPVRGGVDRESEARPPRIENPRTDAERSRPERYDDREREQIGQEVEDYRRYPEPEYARRRIDVAWPWEYRYDRGWRSRYEFRQVVYVENRRDWRGRDTRLDIRTRYHHQVRSANRHRAEVDLYIDEIEVYENGRFLGRVRRVPAEIGRVRAVIYRNGRMDMDRSLFIVGDPHAGFEMINTRYYHGYYLSSYGYARGMRAGVLDFRFDQVRPIRRTRLYDPDHYDRFIPIALLPEDGEWLYDYGYGSASAYLHGRPGYHYYGGRDDADEYYFGDEEWDRANASRSTTSGGVTPTHGWSESGATARGAEMGRNANSRPQRGEALERSQDEEVKLDDGSSVRIRRQVELKRIE